VAIMRKTGTGDDGKPTGAPIADESKVWRFLVPGAGSQGAPSPTPCGCL